MGLLRRNTTDEDRIDERTERAGTSPGLIRALATLLGVAAAGLLIWIAQEIAGTFDEASSGEFWLAMALLAGAGLVLGLSQLFGGWTKWGWPRLSPTVFLLGFLPTLIVGGWIALTVDRPDSRPAGWADDIGLGGLFESLATYLPAIPLIVGLVLAFSFDTTGPRTRIVSRERTVPDEDVHDYRREPVGTTTTGTTVGTPTTRGTDTHDDTSVAEEIRTRDDRSTVGTGARVDRDDDTRRTL